MRGSWNRKPASGYEIVRVRFADGQPQRVEPFVTGFLTDGGTTHIARPVGLAVARDGSLLMADDANGVIYRIAYAGTAATRKALKRARDGRCSRRRPRASACRSRSSARRRRARMTVGSPTVEGTDPRKHTEYSDGVSPRVFWTAVEGAKSYALIMEDPDAKPITPFVHWVAWNIPGNETHLPEGLQEQDRLTEPEGMMQGRKSRGSVGLSSARGPRWVIRPSLPLPGARARHDARRSPRARIAMKIRKR